MESYKYCIIPLSLIFLWIGGCKKNDNPLTTDKLPLFLYGLVHDSQGNPVEGCGVHYMYSMTTSSLAKRGKTCPSTTISFNIPTRSKVTIKIFRWFTQDTIATLIDDTLNAGLHTIVFDASKHTNGIYIYQLRTDTTVQERFMSFLVTDVSALASSNPLVTTNSSGAFSIPFGVFGFSVPFQRTSVSGLTLDTVYISHTIQIVLCKTGYLTAMKTITIDETNGMNQSFTITKQ
jgi:hypothetical protein